MKKALLLTYIICIANYAKSQSYIPMIEDSMLVVNAINGFSHPDYILYKYLGDTSINGNLYFKCYQDTNLQDSSYRITSSMKYYGAIREQNKKVFFLKKDSLVENKIYDYDLSINDTTQLFYSNRISNNHIYTKLDSIDSSNLFFNRNVYTYTYGLSFSKTLVIAEGFGNLTYTSNEINTMYATRKQCVIKKNNLTHNIPSNYNACYQSILNSYVTVEKLNLEKHIILFPNPVKNIVTVISEKNISELTLIDIQGKEIKKYKINSTEKVLDISFLNKGIYLLKINTKNGIAIKKIIKE